MTGSAVKDDEKEPKASENDAVPHPADDEGDSTGGERTVASAFSAFERDSSVPLPISVPPPATKGATDDPSRIAGTRTNASAPTPRTSPAFPPRPVPTAMPVGKPAAGAPAPPPRASSGRVALPPPPAARSPRPEPAVGRASALAVPNHADEEDPPSARTHVIEGTPLRPLKSEPSLPKLGVDEGDDDDPTKLGPTAGQMIARSMGDAGHAGPNESGAHQDSPPTGRAPSPSTSGAETVGRSGLPVLTPPEHEETTRAVSREELFRSQDAHVVVGADAIGDEATLAVPPGETAGLTGLTDLGPPLEPQRVEPAFPPPSPYRPQQPGPPRAGPPWMQPQGGGHGAAAPAPAPTPASRAGLPIGHGAGAHPMPSGPGPYRVPGPATVGASAPMPMQPQPTHHQPQPPPMTGGWPPPPAGPLPKAPRAASKISPQLIALVVVGAVCFAIFIVGVYLYATTKF